MLTDHRNSFVKLFWRGLKDHVGTVFTIRGQLYAIILVFAILITSSLITTAVSVQSHSNDEIVVDVAQYQLALSQQGIWMVLERSDDHNLATLIQEFDQNLLALKEGGLGVGTRGNIVDLPVHESIAIQTQLSTISKTWGDFRESLLKINSLSENEPIQQELFTNFQNQSTTIIEQHNELITLLENHMAGDHRDLFSVQLIYLVLALPLIIWGSYVIRFRIVTPLMDLKEAANDLRQGDLSMPIKMNETDEVGELAQSFENMRSEIAANRDLMESRIAERIRELTIAFEFSQEIISELEFDGLLETIIDKARNLMRTEQISLCLVKPGENKIEMFANHLGVISRNIPQQSIDNVGEIVGKDQMIDARVNDLACKFLIADSSSRCLAVPLRVGDRTIGALCVLRDMSLKFEENEKRAFALLANSAAIAIENAQLIKEGELQTKRNAIVAERQRLASELHDNLAQTLNLVNLKINQIQKRIAENPDPENQSEIKFVQKNVESAIDQVRMIVSEMASPIRVNKKELMEQLKFVVKEFDEITGIAVSLDASRIDESVNHLTQLVQEQLLMIIKEALTNVQKHADAENVAIYFNSGQDCIFVTIEDDGKGFQLEEDRGTYHYGLRIMQTRAERSGGSVRIESAPNTGTRVIVSLPLENRETV